MSWFSHRMEPRVHRWATSKPFKSKLPIFQSVQQTIQSCLLCDNDKYSASIDEKKNPAHLRLNKLKYAAVVRGTQPAAHVGKMFHQNKTQKSRAGDKRRLCYLTYRFPSSALTAAAQSLGIPQCVTPPWIRLLSFYKRPPLCFFNLRAVFGVSDLWPLLCCKMRVNHQRTRVKGLLPHLTRWLRETQRAAAGCSHVGLLQGFIFQLRCWKVSCVLLTSSPHWLRGVNLRSVWLKREMAPSFVGNVGVELNLFFIIVIYLIPDQLDCLRYRCRLT